MWKWLISKKNIYLFNVGLHQVLVLTRKIFHCGACTSLQLRLSCPMACRILVPQPASPPLEGRFLTTRPLGESQKWLLNWVMGRGVKSFEPLGKILDCPEGTIGGNMNIKRDSGEDLERKVKSHRESCRE